jgi:mRNA interferase RelE/StbE
MEIYITRTFQKEVRSLSAPIQVRVFAIINSVRDAENLNDIPNIKSMAGHHDFYRIRLGDFRIGVFKRLDNVVEFQRVGTRGQFYKRFP